ncbi:MAG TPA: hypothetical protein VFK36_00350 [Gemmatimonadales bacterium]|nr:hypothetical protein [Gemmatimonadales bacterium]
MTIPQPSSSAGQRLLGRRNLILLAAAVLALILGYAVLSAGHPTAAAVLLVVGYCVLFPLGIAL